ncbi:MAG: glycosyltransferase family 4 protein [Planctomycetia bacterium]|jgi:alpha-1,2-rhamnosyltransferase
MDVHDFEATAVRIRMEADEGRSSGARQQRDGSGAAAPAGTPRLLIDCTQTMRTPVTTGIQRVVRNLVKHGQAVAGKRGMELVPIRFNGHVFERATMSADGELLVQSCSAQTLTRRILLRLKKIFINRRVDRQLKRLRQVLFTPSATPAGFSFLPHDILVLPDSSWTEQIWPEVDRARSGGLVVGVLQHDFIPIRNPELVPEHSTEIFRRWMTESLSRADFVLAVSHTIAAECREELRGLRRQRVADQRVGVCPNGADFKPGRVRGAVRSELKAFVRGNAGGPYFTLGTIEPRKNQTIVLDALDEVLAACPEERFLIAGIVGWKGSGIARRIRGHARYGTNLMLIEDLNDAEVAYAYEHAKAVVFPSLAEGFGLPIVEAIARGTRVFASGIAVHQEVGSDFCVYFDPTDAGHLARVLIGYSKHGTFPATWPPQGFRLPTWQAAAETMVGAAVRNARDIRHAAGRIPPGIDHERPAPERLAS